jgi:hypothetical protein
VLLGEDQAHIGVYLVVVFILRFSGVLLADEDTVCSFIRYFHRDVVRFALVVHHSERTMHVHWVQLADVYCPIKFLEILPIDEEASIVGIVLNFVLFSKLWCPLFGFL